MIKHFIYATVGSFFIMSWVYALSDISLGWSVLAWGFSSFFLAICSASLEDSAYALALSEKEAQ